MCFEVPPNRFDQTHQLPFTIKHYSLNLLIGCGAFSQVYQAIDKKNGQHVAIKVISREIFQQEANLINLEKELRILERIDHPSITKYIETIFTEDYIYIVMEFLTNGTLADLLRGNFALISEHTKIRWIKEVLEGLQYLHRRGIAHRDLKPDNIAFDSNMRAKLIDFGLSTESSQKMRSTTPCGTPFFTAPEVILGTSYNAVKADIWSFGMTLYIMINQRFPFPDMTQKRYINQLHKLRSVMDNDYNGKFATLLQRSLVIDPHLRGSVDDLLKDPIFLNAEDLSYVYLPFNKPTNLLQKHQSKKKIPIMVKSTSMDASAFKPHIFVPTVHSRYINRTPV